MKATLISMIAVLAASLALCLYSMYSQFSALDELDHIRAQAIEAVHARDDVHSEELLTQLANVFQDYAHTLEMIASHDDLHEAYSNIVDARISLECGDMDDTYQALAQLGESLEHLRAYEKLSIANIY